MAVTVKKLRLRDLIRDRSGSLVYRILLFIFGIALQLFFRRIETVGADRVPSGTGVIFVLNHPNGLIDPALVFIALPRRITFLAKSTLFEMPVISFLLKTAEALPVYRRIDKGEDVSNNIKTFEAAHDLLRRGGSIALFPEGVSHNSPKLLPMKTGAARIALGSVAAGGEPITVRIVPVGLFYTSKTTFRSEALLHFGEFFEIDRAEVDENGQPTRESVRELTDRIEEALRDVTLNAETEAELTAAGIADDIFRTTADAPSLGDRLAFRQRFIKLSNSRTESDLEKIDERLRDFDSRLDAMDIEAEHLSLARFTRRFVVWRAAASLWYLVLLLPLAVIGVVLHFPAYQVCKLLAHIYARHGADDVASTVKVLAGMIFMPLTWFAVAGVAYFYLGWIYAIAAIPLSVLTGWIALVTLESAAELSGWAIGIWRFLTDKDRFIRLYLDRREIQRDLASLEK